MSDEILNFLRGGTMIALAGVACFFLRYWRQTKDRLFGFFAAGFTLLAISQTVVLSLGPAGDKLPVGYWLRLAAFVLIIVGIVEKNLPKKDKSAGPNKQ